jgi:glycogen debranching enzyme
MAAPSPDVVALQTPLVLTSAGDVETLVSAHGTRYAVTNRNGDVVPPGARELGFFVDDTRHLSHYELRLDGLSFVHLSSDSIDPACNRVDLMLSGLGDEKFLDDPQHFLHVRRRQLVDDGFSDEIRLVNYLQRPIAIEIAVHFAADFADVFEVRGAKRPRRGSLLAPVIEDASVELAYRALDGAVHTTRLTFSPTPHALAADCATFRMALEPGKSACVEIRAEASATRPAARRRTRFEERVREKARAVEGFRQASTQFRCDNEMIQHFLEQAATDLHALSLDIGGNRVVAAGIPWFCCPFGRDTLLASYEALTLNPDLATSSLRALAALQGTKFDDFTEEEPGRILHELRFGEMAACKEIPHLPYYGSIDATPLFVIVAHATYKVTSDRALLVDLRAAITSALAWIDRRSACGTRPVTYDRRSERGLDNQGWKDSRAGVSFPDGRRAEPPIALCEVQGYCADAYRRGARLLLALGEEDAARTYEERARTMSALIERSFWIPDENRYAFAIDGHHRALPTVVSNLGHLLWSRVADPTRARATADLLMAPESLSGFGIRTLAAGQPVYNPLSYHNGTVWPHDNAIIAKGFANYGFAAEACTVFEALVAAMGYFRDRRLPELFCGMSRSPKTLVRYPVACSPQAWAAAAPFLLLQAVLGLHIDGPAQRVTIRNPSIPRSMTRLELDRLRVGSSRISLRIRRFGKRCHVDRFDIEGAPLRTNVELG